MLEVVGLELLSAVCPREVDHHPQVVEEGFGHVGDGEMQCRTSQADDVVLDAPPHLLDPVPALRDRRFDFLGSWGRWWFLVEDACKRPEPVRLGGRRGAATLGSFTIAFVFDLE